jgi:hypothetical protein
MRALRPGVAALIWVPLYLTIQVVVIDAYRDGARFEGLLAPAALAQACSVGAAIAVIYGALVTLGCDISILAGRPQVTELLPVTRATGARALDLGRGAVALLSLAIGASLSVAGDALGGDACLRTFGQFVACMALIHAAACLLRRRGRWRLSQDANADPGRVDVLLGAVAWPATLITAVLALRAFGVEPAGSVLTAMPLALVVGWISMRLRADLAARKNAATGPADTAVAPSRATEADAQAPPAEPPSEGAAAVKLDMDWRETFTGAPWLWLWDLPPAEARAEVRRWLWFALRVSLVVAVAVPVIARLAAAAMAFDLHLSAAAPVPEVMHVVLVTITVLALGAAWIGALLPPVVMWGSERSEAGRALRALLPRADLTRWSAHARTTLLWQAGCFGIAAASLAVASALMSLLGGPVERLAQHVLALSAVPTSALAVTAALWLVRRPADHLEPGCPGGCALGCGAPLWFFAVFDAAARLGRAIPRTPGTVLTLYTIAAALLALAYVLNLPVLWRRRPDGRPTVLARATTVAACLVALAAPVFVSAAVVRLLL